MSLEFGSSGFSSELENYAKSMEQFNAVFANLEGIQSGLLKKNAETTEFLQQSSLLASKLETASQKEFFNAKYKETSTGKALKKLKDKCAKAKTLKELSSISAEYEKLMGQTSATQYTAAIKQQGINAGVAVKNAVEDMSAPLELNADKILTSAPKAADVVKNQVDDTAKIMEEALKRTQAEQAAQKTAEKAQKFYSSLSDSTIGKSAKESAEVIEASIKAAEEKQAKITAEALKRTQAEQTAQKTAEKAQKFYSSLSDSTVGKSAKESAEIIKQNLDKADEAAKALAQANKNNAVKMPLQQLALPSSKQELLALPAHTASDKADDIVKTVVDTVKTQNENAVLTQGTKTSKTLLEKTKDFIKNKAVPFTKTKQFKVITAGTAALALTIGIVKHNKNKQEQTQKLNIVK